jgi:hypothetical protein
MAAAFRRTLSGSLRRLVQGSHGSQRPSCSQLEVTACSTVSHSKAYVHDSAAPQINVAASLEDAVKMASPGSLLRRLGRSLYSTAAEREIFYPQPEVVIGQPAPDFTAPGRQTLGCCAACPAAL